MVRTNGISRRMLVAGISLLMIALMAVCMPLTAVRAEAAPVPAANRVLAAGNTWASSSPHVWYRVVTGKSTITVKFFVTTDKAMTLVTAAPDRDLQGMVSGPSMVSKTGGVIDAVDIPNGNLVLSIGDTLVGTVTAQRPAKAAVWKVTMRLSMRNTATKRMVVRSFTDTFNVTPKS